MEESVKKIKSLGIKSIFRISLVLGSSAGIIGGVYLMILSFMDRQYGEGILYLILGPVLYAILVALMNVLMAWIYNKAAERLGGIEIDLE